MYGIIETINMEFRLHQERFLRHVASMPFIYIMIIPIVLLDIFIEMYHRVCFPLYGIPLLERKAYIRLDRQKLSYLSVAEKINCAYCGYANGLMHYATDIAALTEKYWCGIKHKEGAGYKKQEHQKDFLPYGDKKAFQKFVNDAECKK